MSSQNIGYNAKILSQRTFTMFVVMAIVTTVSTTPLTKLIYPVWYQQKVEKFRRGEIDWEGNPIEPRPSSEAPSMDKLNQSQVHRLLVYLRLDSLPGLFTFISLLGGTDAEGANLAISDASPDAQEQQHPVARRRHLQVHGIRILELTERTSSVMQVSEVDELARRDPIVNTFRTFSQLNDVAVSGQVAVVPAASYPETLTTEATETHSDFVLIPWGERGISDDQSTIMPAASGMDRFDDRAHLDFVHAALEKAVCNTGVFIDNGFGGSAPSSRSDRPMISRTISVLSTHSLREPASIPVVNKSHRVFFPFFGGADDRVALRFVLQLAKNRNITATVAHFNWDDNGAGESSRAAEQRAAHGDVQDPTKASVAEGKEVYFQDEPSAQDLGLISMLQSSLVGDLAERVSFVDFSVHGNVNKVLDDVMSRAGRVVGQAAKNAGDIVVLGRRHGRFGDSTGVASESASGYDLSKTVGVAGARVISSGLKASILVIQAAGRGLEA